MKKLLAKVALVLGVLFISGTAFGAKACTEHEEGTHDWVPDWDGNVSFIYREDSTITHQTFSWVQNNLDNFMSKNAYYQYELKRPDKEEYWDYWKLIIPFVCIRKGYFTNLPNPIEDQWSEETDLWFILGCGRPSWGFDEEFEIKSLDPNALTADVTYFVDANFWRDTEDRGKPMTLQSESEFCGINYFCNRGQVFHWCEMTEQRITG
ncbi:MAG: hypothetical protein Q7K34_01740 [archaeon]|nr:hypothetical protein [archaeon]